MSSPDRGTALSFCLLLFLFLPAGDLAAQRTFGIHYPESSGFEISADEIQWLHESGIRLLMVEEALPDSILAVLRQYDMSLYVLVPFKYPLIRHLTNSGGPYARTADNLFSHYQSDPLVRGLGLFSFGSWQHGEAQERLRSLSHPHKDDRKLFTVDLRALTPNELTPMTHLLLFIQNATDGKKLIGRVLGVSPLAGILYKPAGSVLDLRDFQDLLALASDKPGVPVILDRDWFGRNTTRINPAAAHDLQRILLFYHMVPDARLANPAPVDAKDRSPDTSILLLFVLWLFFAVYYHLNPLYRKSVIRFYLNYDFFVNDLLMKRLRLTSEVLVAYLLTALGSGLLAFAIVQNYLNPVSRALLAHYLPLFHPSWDHPLSFFVWFTALVLIINAVQILWIHAANRKHAQVFQTATFILWSQHLNLLLVTVGVVLLRTYPSAAIASLLVLIHWLNVFASFHITAYNMRRVVRTSLWYISGTYTLYILLVTGVIFWLLYVRGMLEIWQLTISL